MEDTPQLEKSCKERQVSPADRVIDLYQRHGESWEADRRRGIPRDGIPMEKTWLDRFAALIRPDGTVLDLGFGGGIPIAQS